MDKIQHLLYDYFLSTGFSEATAKYLNMLLLLVALIVLVFIVDFIIRKLLINAFVQFAIRSKTNFDDFLISNKVPRNVAHIIPLLITLEFFPTVFFDFPAFENVVEKGLQVFAIILTLWIVRSLLNTLKDYFKTLPRLKDKPIDSYIQVFMIFAWVAGFMSAIAIITGIPFLKFVTGLGAISAVLILVFKDTILGFVASIQVSINDMVRIGDWITFEKYGADGDVIEITLATVKVQNFDKTITTIPTYALISDSFKNWRGMTSSNGRRIKRALNIKLESVKYLSDSDIENLKKIQLLTSYLNKRQTDISTYNQNHDIDKSLLLNGRNLTNIGIFRKYVDTYLKNNSAINKEMTIMVRQLEPTSQGIPIELYAFSKDKRWENYEYIIADIFDHLIASLPYFNLEVFELPSSSSFKS
ncbi:mechanosensitive ion channel family protein [Flaviramulus sp. BrNp1-15]|uniref:mechanosensitive ion channel family protein n=1 Tax=Flaviramulus sp. BrNp1-15 TaxID=2916754 RepID=UPI001EE7EDBC|nr:mechanosensitive ion channel domain-containing protein [Flaviramulus sp. BrNp1-15]ULC58213.1 mechanosensitive ion channel family protein [Flaviramulus sp. BrNp1-15]